MIVDSNDCCILICTPMVVLDFWRSFYFYVRVRKFVMLKRKYNSILLGSKMTDHLKIFAAFLFIVN